MHTIDPSILSEQIRDNFRHFPTGNDTELLNTLYEETSNGNLNKIAPQSPKKKNGRVQTKRTMVHLGCCPDEFTQIGIKKI